jgi:hypothetical protein
MMTKTPKKYFPKNLKNEKPPFLGGGNSVLKILEKNGGY